MRREKKAGKNRKGENRVTDKCVHRHCLLVDKFRSIIDVNGVFFSFALMREILSI